MKFMKLGSKADTFQSEGSCTRYVQSELDTDIIIIVDEIKFHLHKFPLLAKSKKLRKIVSKANEDKNTDDIRLMDFPGGPKAFEICAKFCYGIVVTLNPYNVLATRCASEYLEMNEDIERGNLIFKIEVFLNSSIFRSWKDSIIVLQTVKSLLPWSEDLNVVERCIDSIASKTSVDPSRITWSYTNNRKSIDDGIIEKDWWIEDICELEIELFKRVMVSIKGRIDNIVLGEALKTYALRWLPDSINALLSEAHLRRNKTLVETIICLLPSDKDTVCSCSCSFLLKLLKIAFLLEMDESSTEDLIERIGLKLNEANVNDILIKSRSNQSTMYDIELVKRLVNRFFDKEKSCKRYGGGREMVLGCGSWLNVGKVVDDYLAKIGYDLNLNVFDFIELSQLIPETARPIHDRLYKAIDIYLKEHPNMSKSEKKKLCGLMDVKKFTTDASMHAAQNERLPIRIAVQVLFFEQVRSTPSAHVMRTEASHDESLNSMKMSEEDCKKIHQESVKSLGKDLSGLKMSKNGSRNRSSNAQLVRSRSRRIFDKLWIIGKGIGNGGENNRSSETSGSSQSPSSLIRSEIKLRQRRNSIS